MPLDCVWYVLSRLVLDSGVERSGLDVNTPSQQSLNFLVSRLVKDYNPQKLLFRWVISIDVCCTIG